MRYQESCLGLGVVPVRLGSPHSRGGEPVEFPLVVLVFLIEPLKLPAEILLLLLLPGVLGWESVEDELSPGHLVLHSPVLALGSGDRRQYSDESMEIRAVAYKVN